MALDLLAPQLEKTKAELSVLKKNIQILELNNTELR